MYIYSFDIETHIASGTSPNNINTNNVALSLKTVNSNIGDVYYNTEKN